ncbi:MAG: mechanosensitive ion channel [Planctomycetes bacterium]|nr:mechanosensitive ion channel [Planctomycetota bacterium]
MRLLRGLECILLAVLSGGIGGESSGQEMLPPSATMSATGSATGSATMSAAKSGLTLERVESLRKEAEESTELDEETKKKVAELCRSALTELQRAAELEARGRKCEADAAAVGRQVSQIRRRLSELKRREREHPQGTGLQELEQELSALEPQFAAKKKALVAAEGEPTSRAQQRREMRARLATIPASLEETAKQAESLPADEHAVVTAARKMESAARQLALNNEAPAIENELAKFDAEDAADLVRLQRDLCTQEVLVAERQVELLRDRIKTVRADAALQAVRKARDEAIAADPILKSYAEHNRQLAEMARAITQQFDEADRSLKAAKKDHDQLVRQFEQTRKKVESVGLTSSVGALLRKQRAALPDARKQRTAVTSRRETIDETQYKLLEYDDERQELADPELQVQRILGSTHMQRAQDRELLEVAAREVLERKREYLDSLIRNSNTYFDTLVELDTTEQQIIVLVEQYQQYIDQRVLWIRSGNLLTSEWRPDSSDHWFTSGRRWLEVPQRLWSDFRKNPLLYPVALLVLAVLHQRRRHFRRELRQIGEAAQRPTCRHFGPTLRALALTFGLAALWPGFVGFIAWRLNVAAQGELFAKAVGYGLGCLCAMWLPLELFRQICHAQGLAEAHFGWPSSATQLLRGNLRLLILLGLPLTFVTSTFFTSDPSHGRDAIERTCFILEAAVFALFIRRVLRPGGGVFKEYIAYHQGGWIDRLEYFWFWLGVTGPLLLAGLAFWGYYYTAQVLSWRLYATMCFVAALVLVRAMLLRLILVRRRKLSIEQARERASAAAQAGEQTTAMPAGIVTEQPQADLSAHSLQTQRLLTTGMLATTLVGLWLIWVEVLPALSMLDRWPLWTITTTVHAAETRALPTTRPNLDQPPAAEPAAEPAATPTRYQRTSITFSNVALAVLIAVITFVSARNVPGLLEISVLQRLPLDASVRYAVTSLVSYGIVLLGAIVACSNIGLRWSQIQWLATALTFGLAFGLQEIFANFMAGLIILFERPIRVGDIVTVDNVSGVVSRIRIRATSITNWDRKEYVVPNKEFITGRLLNWTLSDQVNRIVINVGIAYGSDTEKAREVLLRIANEHPLILKEPKSMATFENFGDNSLNLTLRTFLPNMENRLQVIHDLHTAIDKQFRQAGIEIAFPQRDLHIRSIPDALATALSPRRKAA